MTMFVEMLRRLRQIAEQAEPNFRSDGFRTLFAMMRRELSDDYFKEVSTHLTQLKFPDFVAVSARLEAGQQEGIGYTLRQLPADHRFWPLRFFPRRLGGYTLYVHPRDEAGGQAVSALRNRGSRSQPARSVSRSTTSSAYFTCCEQRSPSTLGASIFRSAFSALGLTTVVPVLASLGEHPFACRGLYDVCLAISMNKAVVGNDVDGNDKELVVITGANFRVEATFLRSVGVAQVMMQSGLFVGAEAFGENIVRGVFTHCKREEDTSMTSGKFDEELLAVSPGRKTRGRLANLQAHRRQGAGDKFRRRPVQENFWSGSCVAGESPAKPREIA